MDGRFRASVVDRRHPHARYAVSNLVGETLAHEAGADHADTDRLAFGFPRLQRVVDDDHVRAPAGARLIRRLNSTSISLSGFHCASFGDSDATGSGHFNPRRGSSNLRPPSCWGA